MPAAPADTNRVPSPENNPFINAADLARVLRVGVPTIKNHHTCGRLPPYDVVLGTKASGWWLETLRQWNPSVAQRLAQEIAP